MLPGITFFSDQIDGAHAYVRVAERNTFFEVEARGEGDQGCCRAMVLDFG